MQTEISDTRPSKSKKYRGEKNKIHILLYIQTESSDARPSRRFSTSSAPFFVCWRMLLYAEVCCRMMTDGEVRQAVIVDDQCLDVCVVV